MKIELKITNHQVLYINEMIADNLIDPNMARTKEEKSFVYLMHDISNKLLKRTIENRDNSKAFKLSLKYYEAFAFHEFLLRFDFEYNSLERIRVTRQILGIINQKLV